MSVTPILPKIAPEQVKRNNHFLTHLLAIQNLKNDAALARALEIAPAVLSKIRHGRLQVSPSTMISAHELLGISFQDMRSYLPKAA